MHRQSMNGMPGVGHGAKPRRAFAGTMGPGRLPRRCELQTVPD